MTDIETARGHLAAHYPEAAEAILRGDHDETPSIRTIMAAIKAERDYCLAIVDRHDNNYGSTEAHSIADDIREERA